MSKATWKLIRDKIPSMMEIKPHLKELTDSDYSKALAKKLDEETKELKQELALARSHQVRIKEGTTGLDPYNKERIIDEMSDVLEVLAAISEHHKIDNDTLFAHAAKKRKEKGGFLKRIYAKFTK